MMYLFGRMVFALLVTAYTFSHISLPNREMRRENEMLFQELRY